MFGATKRHQDVKDSGKVDTIIGEEAELKGAFHSKGVVRIDGYLEGSIEHQGHLIVGPTGRLVATVKTRTFAVAGEVRGDVEVDAKLELLPGARMIGDISCGHLVVHEGAMFQGRSQMQDHNTVTTE